MLLDLVAPRRFSIDEYHRLLDKGVLRRGARTELVEGLLIDVPPPGHRHAAAVSRLRRAVAKAMTAGLIARWGEPLTLSQDTEVEPDASITSDDDRSLRHPSTARLVLDVADERLELCRSVKLRQYARAGVAECWLINVPDRRIEVYWKPDPTPGSYQDQMVVAGRGSASSTVLPALSVAVAELFD